MEKQFFWKAQFLFQILAEKVVGQVFRFRFTWNSFKRKKLSRKVKKYILVFVHSELHSLSFLLLKSYDTSSLAFNFDLQSFMTHGKSDEWSKTSVIQNANKI